MTPTFRVRGPQTQRGFTLLGVLIAVALVVVASLGVAGLAQQTGRAGRLAKNRLVATYLAREGIELVRGLRDDSFLAFVDSSVPPVPRCETAPCTLAWRGDPLSSDLEEQRRALCNGTWIVEPDIGVSGKPSLFPLGGAAPNGELFLTPAFAYTHQGGTNVPTPFTRLVEITTLTQSGDVGTGTDNCGETYDVSAASPSRPKAFAVQVKVAWEDRGARSVELVEELYPWMRYR